MTKYLTATVAGIAIIASLASAAPAYAKVVDGGIRTSKIEESDTVTGREAHAYAAPALGNSQVQVSETISYLHPRGFWHPFGNDVKYKIQITTSANWVGELNQWMLRDTEGGFFAFHSGQKLGEFIAKPVIEMGERDAVLSADDGNVIAALQAGNMSSNGNFRTVGVTHRYTHEELYFNRTYSLKASFTATWVPEQRAHMGWYQNQLYSVSMGSSDVRHLQSKAYADLGTRFTMMDWRDEQIHLNVTPYSLTNDGYSVMVHVNRTYRHEDQFQKLDYDIVSTSMAVYNPNWDVWTTIVDGRMYAIAFGNETVTDGNVIVVRAPSNIHRPKVVVVDPNGGNSGGPVVVVPKKPGGPVVVEPNNGNSGGPVVVVPKKPGGPVVVKPNNGNSDGPVVVVPKKPNHGPVVIDGDDDNSNSGGPAVVVPAKPRG